MLAEDARVAASFAARLVGLMGRDVRENEALGLPHCPSVHTCFVSRALDVIFCDDAGRVLRVVAGLRPWRVGPFVPRAAMTWEGRAGALAPFARVGDVLAVEAV